MNNSLILCGGTGAHVAVAFLRLHTLGCSLGFFDQGGRPFFFPSLFLVDQDSGDANEADPTAWQLARRLADAHPARYNWEAATGRREPPDLVRVTPLPVGPRGDWYQVPFSTLRERFATSSYLRLLASLAQQEIDYSKGMMGSPAIGALLFQLKQYDARDRANYDQTYGEMLRREGRIVVAGSGVGGTGAAVGPTLAQSLAEDKARKVMAVMLLNWFKFDEEVLDQERRRKAQARNRVMQENASSALQFYGRQLARTIATVPVGMPNIAMVERQYTSDLQQPVCDSFVHTVAAISAARHFLDGQGYDPGLYAMGAVDRGRLDGATAIPGGTLADLVLQGTTLAHLLRTWQRVLTTPHVGSVRPALYNAVARLGAPGLIAERLGREIEHYEQQLRWMRETLGLSSQPAPGFTREAESRERLRSHEFPVPPGTDPERVAAGLFEWTSRWIRERATQGSVVRTEASRPSGGYWPDLRVDGRGFAVEKKAGELTRVKDQDIDGILDGFVDPKLVTTNGWPHPVAAADYFRYAIQQADRVAFRQLELLLAGFVAGVLELRELPAARVPQEPAVTLESLLAEHKTEYPEVATALLVYRPQAREGEEVEMVVGFNSPHTLFCPVPYLNDTAANSLWRELWEAISGASDGAGWNEFDSEPRRWERHDLVVRQVKAWLDRHRRTRRGPAPPWTKVFETYPGSRSYVPYGTGPLLPVFWGPETAAGRLPLAELALPTKEVGVWDPSDDSPRLDESRLMVPELARFTDVRGDSYEMVEFEIPDEELLLRGLWEEHLDALVEAGRIEGWQPTAEEAVVIRSIHNDESHVTVLSRSRFLSRKTVAIADCRPLHQNPVPGSRVPKNQIKYPDLPIRGDYLGLVRTLDGKSLLSDLKRGGRVDLAGVGFTQGRDSANRKELVWSLPMLGRSTPFTVSIRSEGEPSRAHWMVWPRFRSAKAPGWKAYYVYERCDIARLALDTLWLDQEIEETGRLRRRPAQDGSRAYPVQYAASPSDRMHTGGPPLALSLRSLKNNEELGLYLVPLEVLPAGQEVLVKMAVDFGTSHSLAAVRIGEGTGDAIQVRLRPELDPLNSKTALSLHISEDAAHVIKPVDGVLALGRWLPTYCSTAGWNGHYDGSVPSELLLTNTLAEVRAEDVSGWVPVRDFVIPSITIARQDLAEYVLTDFKWDVSSNDFHGREGDLRDHYLAFLLEMVMAEVVAEHVKGFPKQPAQVTFTYPLRTSETQVKRLSESLQRAVGRASQASGVQIELFGGIGIYDESRAAQVLTRQYGEVCLVADLGGGTLDLFMSARNRDEASPEERLPEVADSVRLGGSLLLHYIAENASKYLPRDGGWFEGQPDAKDVEAKLRTWMRAKGAHALFGREAGGRPRLEGLEVYGFGSAAEDEADAARHLIDRYFRLIVEYLARNLTAYLVRYWYPRVKENDHGRLRLSVQLRGNGWRLRHQEETYDETTRAIQEDVKRRVEELWAETRSNGFAFPADGKNWAPVSAVDDPKAAPVRRAVGEKMRFEEVKRGWHSHTLINLEVLDRDGATVVDWWEKVPFATRGSRQVQLEQIAPPLKLSSPNVSNVLEISTLERELVGRINRGLQKEAVFETDGMYYAPVAPLVWETVFASKAFKG